MFRLAFPYADADEESAEMAYLESRFDTDVANGGMTTRPRGRRTQGVLPPGSTGVRLQGVWIPCEEVSPIAEDYGLLEIAQPLIEATAVLHGSVPLLNLDAPSTPSRQTKRQRMVDSGDASETSTPLPQIETASPRRTPRRTRAATAAAAAAASNEAPAKEGAPSTGAPTLTPAQIEEQIAAAKSLAASIQADAAPSAARAKRPAEDVEDDEPKPAVAPTTAAVASRGARRHRNLSRAASVLTAAGAVGLGAAALYSGQLNLASMPGALHQLQNVDYASALSAIQQNIQSWGVSWFT